MPRPLTIILVGSLAITQGCEYGEWTLPEGDGDLVPDNDEAKLFLTRTEQGDLEYCAPNAPEECEIYDNPGDCHTLEVAIQLYTGKTCETCLDAAGQQKAWGCSATNVGCTVFTAPEPDCVVCAYLGGDVIYSSCSAEPPAECFHRTDVPISNGCDICYDASGRKVIDTCPIECTSAVCPLIRCGPGYEERRPASECCPLCVPTNSCAEKLCAFSDYAVPKCPAGTDLVRDPADCCYYYCQAEVCPDGSATFDTPTCPVDHIFAEEFPYCGQCVPEPDEEVICSHSEQCAQEEQCTNVDGECLADPSCPPGDSDCVSLHACHGVCRPDCLGVDGIDTQGGPQPVCEGEFRFAGMGSGGCPTVQCFCPGGVVSVDGTCPNLCADAFCSAAAISCSADERLVSEYPHCCGICVPKNTCVPGDTINNESDDSGFTSTFGCPEIHCLPGFHPEVGPDCCQACVRDNVSCVENDDCLVTETCVHQDPSGTCMPTVHCADSDGGIDPLVAGHVEGKDALGNPYKVDDRCWDENSLSETYCYPPFAGTTIRFFGTVVVECEMGCMEGACLTSNPG